LFVNARDIAHWSMTANAWAIEKGMHQVLVGPSADPTKLLMATFNVN
jgi:hypothetical protein